MVIDIRDIWGYNISKGGHRYDAKNTLKTGKGHHSVILSVGRRLLRRCCSVRGCELLADAPDSQYCYLPWLIFMELMVIPDYAVLVYAWKISYSIGRDRAFSSINAKRFRRVSLLALTTTVYFFVGNTVFFLLNMNHPAVYMVSFVLTFIGASIAAAAAILSYLSRKAADLQEESDLTI